MLRQTRAFALCLAFLTLSVGGQRLRSIQSDCPHLYPQLFKGYIPRGNLTSGNLTRIDEVETVNQCVIHCCVNDHCNIVLIYDAKCYHVSCVSNDLCMPILSPVAENTRHVSLILVKPVSAEEIWGNLLNTNEDALNQDIFSSAKVTVLPPKRINQPPQVIINPPTQTIKLPNTKAVLDASGTKFDDGIVSWHWELLQGPLGYQPRFVDTPTLQLNNLAIPGYYIFKVTVTDTDNAINSSTANITVLQIIDYPPEANTGPDVIVYLPHNKVTLNGNLSTDDRAIVSWEWTKSPSDADKAADMQDTRTPYLNLSNLEEGMYTFFLKVTDSANQSSSSEVHVFVKPPANKHKWIFCTNH